jgi:glutathione S-transferase
MNRVDKPEGSLLKASSPSFRVARRSAPASSQSWRRAWQRAGTRVIQDNKSARGEVSIADVVQKIRAESSAQAARRLLRSARQRTKKAVAAKGSRNVIFSSGYLYFLVLEKPWWFTAALSLGAYAATIFACFVLSLPLPLYNEFEETEDGDASQAALALRFATAHVITGSPAEVLPTTEAGRFVSYLSMLAGVVVNVFVFAAVVAKFQSPQKDLVWSTKGVMAKRDGVPTLLVRVGNLRCHTLYNPTIRCTLLSRHVTAEGEGFMKKETVEVMQPATVSGVHTIACAVDKRSPLFPILQTSRFVHCPVLGAASASGERSNGERSNGNKKNDSEKNDSDASDSDASDEPFQWLLHVTFTALDPVYGAELCSHTTYTDDSLVGPARFKDVIGVDARGRPVIDWHAFDDHVDGCDHDADDSSDDDDDDGDDETAMRDSSDDGDEEERAIARAMADVKRVRAERERSVAFVAAPVPAAAAAAAAAAGTSHPSTRVSGDASPPAGSSAGKRSSPTRSEISDDSAKEPSAAPAAFSSSVANLSLAAEPRTPPPGGAPRAHSRVSADAAPDSENGGSRAYTEGSSVFVFRSTTCGPTERAQPGPEGLPVPGAPRIAVLAARGSRGMGDDIDGDAPQGPLVTYCVFCVRLCLIFAEARVPFELVEIDRNCKQSWFQEAFPEFTTPAVQGTPGGKANGEWVGNSGSILADAVEAEPRVRAAARLRGGVTLERAARLGQTITAALVCGRLLGTKYEHGQAMANECLVKCGVLPREDEEKEDDDDEEEERASTATKNLVDRSFADDEDALRALRARVVDAGAQAAREIESLLTSSSKPHPHDDDGPFLGGKSPDAADAYLVAALWVAHNLLTSGVARCFAAERGDGATCSFAALGAPSALAYLRAWSARPSWRAVMRAEDTVSSAASLRPLVDGLVAAAPDSCDPRDMLKCMDRARAGDAYYARAVARFGATLPPVPPAAERPLRVPGHVTTWRPEAIEEARTPGELRDVLKTAGGGEADRGTEAAAPASIAPPANVAPPTTTPVAVAPPASPLIAVAQPPPPPVTPAPPPPPSMAAPPPPPAVSEPAPPSPPRETNAPEQLVRMQLPVAAAAAPPAEPFPSEPSSAAPAIAREDSQKKVKKKKPKKSRTNATICI